MKTIKLTLAFFISICSVSAVKSQTVSVKQQGTYGQTKLMTQAEYTDVTGSAYLDDDFKPGTAKLATGSNYKGDLKYDQVKDRILFKGDKDEDMLFVDPVSEFVITDEQGQRHFRNGYNVNDFTPKSFFEVLADGSAQLIKKNAKSIDEYTPYNSASSEKKFSDHIKYYIVVQGKATQVKADEKSFLAAIGNKQTELDTYFKTNKLNLKKDDDMVKFVMYYNSL